MRRMVFCMFALGLWLGCGGQAQDAVPESSGTAQDLGGIAVSVPDGWVTETPANAMRRAQYKLPGDAGEAELVVTHFGTGGAGGTQANLDRWRGQFSESDGGQTRTLTVSDMTVTVLDISGTFMGMQRPMGGGNTAPKGEQRMLAAIVESSNGAFYFKLVGPKDTVTAWASSFDQFVQSVAPSKQGA
jgi:hypothetical protein